MHQAVTVIRSIAMDTKLVFYGLLLLVLHVAGVVFLYRWILEFDNIPHIWFGYVLSEYSSRGAASIDLQTRLTKRLQNHDLATNFQQMDYVVRLAGFLLIGGLFWELAELFFSPLLGIKPDSFFAFPITLKNIDGALDVATGVIGATLAFLITTKQTKEKAG